MGWTDAHLFEFTGGGRAYGVIEPDPECEPKQYKAASVCLKGLTDRGIDYPAFVDGERRCPPEDVGNAEGFMVFLEAALVPGHPEHDRMVA